LALATDPMEVDPESAFGVLWGKSNAGGQVNLLLQHLLDTAAVAEMLWDNFFSPAVRDQINACSDGQGRSVFVFLCGVHDVGKASPAFQAKVDLLAARVREVGLGWKAMNGESGQWHHSLAGAVVVRRTLEKSGWSKEGAVSWTWPLVAGHHGTIPSPGRLARPPGRGNAQGLGPWIAVQDALVKRVAHDLGLDLRAIEPKQFPRRGLQLALSGAVIMADWIASDEHHFLGVGSLGTVSMEGARERARRAWEELGLRGGWDRSCLLPPSFSGDAIKHHFDKVARPMQADAIELARTIKRPGLLILEAPMGEGKTEAALAAVEVLAERFGSDGVFIGMPTQATSDPMFSRVRQWLSTIDSQIPVGLLHGKRRFNKEWHALTSSAHFHGVDEFGCDDHYGIGVKDSEQMAADTPSEWFLGPKRGLLTPVTVGTIDQLLYAATRSRHVMLRHAGLAGRVVVLDEVHAYDVYMAQFLFEALRWLADAEVPVILLSATLPPSLRGDLARAYLQGALQERDLDMSGLPANGGYPSALSVCATGGKPEFKTRSSPPWRASTALQVEILDDALRDGEDLAIALLTDALGDGGCALVVRNTVGRAQELYGALTKVFGADTILLHGRLTAAARAERTERVLELLGPPDQARSRQRPARLVVIATQLAEQSFDVDVDLLLSDIAPADLLLQRVGRLHRHERERDERPASLRLPRAVITDMTLQGDAPPLFGRGSTRIYGGYPLLRSAALVLRAADGAGWSIPEDVPELVRLAYGDAAILPDSWVEETKALHRQWLDGLSQRASRAESFLLSGADNLGMPTLAGLHEMPLPDPSEDEIATVVRDGDPSVEVVLVRRCERGYHTLGGRWLGTDGEAVSDASILEEVVGSTVRLPAALPDLTIAAQTLRPLSGWGNDPWLRRARALVLERDSVAHLGKWTLSYDEDLGLLHRSTP
jgi:CRISPR-associated endonuclease/helicase Cas3